MTGRTATVPYPQTLRPDVLTNGRNLIRGQGPRGPCLIAYDPLNQCAGIFHEEAFMWSMWTPIDFAGFLAALSDQGFTVPEGSDLQTWLDAVSELAGVTRQ